jgi:hypothetical protein
VQVTYIELKNKTIVCDGTQVKQVKLAKPGENGRNPRGFGKGLPHIN